MDEKAKDRLLREAAQIIADQNKQIQDLKRKNRGLNNKIAELQNLLVAVLRWHFCEGGSAPELITDEIKSTVPPSEVPFSKDERDGVTIIFATGAMLR